MRFAIDAMGGDRAPEAPVEGALQALAAFDDVELILAGDPARIEALADGFEMTPDVAQRLHIHDAPEAIGGAGDPVRAIRTNERLSARAVADLLTRGTPDGKPVDGVITMGNTGAAVAAATLRCRRLEGVRRLGIAVPLPRVDGIAITIDAGANPDSRAEDLHQYALMAAHYARAALQVEAPKIGILSIGEERSKGNRLVQETWELFEAQPIEGFIGNIEPRQIFFGEADVVVCEGFVGNILLKAAEGMGEFALGIIRDIVGSKDPALAKDTMNALASRIDYSRFGGAPLLGLHGGYLIGHGRSGPEAYVSAVRALHRYVEGRVTERIVDALSPVATSDGSGERA